jgi:hypothetical protein
LLAIGSVDWHSGQTNSALGGLRKALGTGCGRLCAVRGFSAESVNKSGIYDLEEL